MNTVVWIVQGVLAAMFGVAGFFKLTMPKDNLKTRMRWVKQYTSSGVMFIG